MRLIFVLDSHMSNGLAVWDEFLSVYRMLQPMADTNEQEVDGLIRLGEFEYGLKVKPGMCWSDVAREIAGLCFLYGVWAGETGTIITNDASIHKAKET